MNYYAGAYNINEAVIVIKFVSTLKFIKWFSCLFLLCVCLVVYVSRRLIFPVFFPLGEGNWVFHHVFGFGFDYIFTFVILPLRCHKSASSRFSAIWPHQHQINWMTSECHTEFGKTYTFHLCFRSVGSLACVDRLKTQSRKPIDGRQSIACQTRSERFIKYLSRERRSHSFPVIWSHC